MLDEHSQIRSRHHSRAPSGAEVAPGGGLGDVRDQLRAQEARPPMFFNELPELL